MKRIDESYINGFKVFIVKSFDCGKTFKALDTDSKSIDRRLNL
jgi:hypothetical protein